MKKAKIGMFTSILCGTMMWTACSTAWTGEAAKIVAALIPATANLVTLVATLQGRSISASDLQTIQSAGTEAGADLKVIQGLITQYQQGVEVSAQPGLLNQIQAEMNAVRLTLNNLLPALHIKDVATQTKIAAVVGLLLSEVESMAAILPLVNPGSSPGLMTMAAKQVKKQAPLTANEFTSSYNATLTAKTGNTELDHAAEGLKIHSHQKVARWASAGLLK
jgi:hypothetical protein